MKVAKSLRQKLNVKPLLVTSLNDKNLSDLTIEQATLYKLFFKDIKAAAGTFNYVLINNKIELKKTEKQVHKMIAELNDFVDQCTNPMTKKALRTKKLSKEWDDHYLVA